MTQLTLDPKKAAEALARFHNLVPGIVADSRLKTTIMILPPTGVLVAAVFSEDEDEKAPGRYIYIVRHTTYAGLVTYHIYGVNMHGSAPDHGPFAGLFSGTGFSWANSFLSSTVKIGQATPEDLDAKLVEFWTNWFKNNSKIESF